MVTLSLRDEATRLLQELIRLDTVNPPGNETQAAELLRDYLAGHGVESELYGRTPERSNLVARLPGRGDVLRDEALRGGSERGGARRAARHAH